MPLMLVELALAIYFFVQNSLGAGSLLQLILVGLIWGSTFLIQIPLHNRLVNQKEEGIINRLVQSNWIRTFLWTGKALLLSYGLLVEGLN